MHTLSTRPRSTPKHIPLILELAVLAWLLLGAVAYLLGAGALTLLEMVGRS